MFYKGDVWFTLWQGHAFIELYEMTGDREWLKLATDYVDTVIRPGSLTLVRGHGLSQMEVGTVPVTAEMIAVLTVSPYHAVTICSS